jgi:hypothetical protein
MNAPQASHCTWNLNIPPLCWAQCWGAANLGDKE